MTYTKMLDCVMLTEHCLTTMLNILHKYQEIEQIYYTWSTDFALEKDFNAMMQIKNVIKGEKKE